MDFKLGVPFCNPFRSDRNPSMSIFRTRQGVLYHTDWADTFFKGTVTDLVAQLYSLDFNDTLRRIDRDMKLGITNPGENGYQKIIEHYRRPTEKEEEDAKAPTLIQAITRKFDTADLAYWEKYAVTHKDLLDLRNSHESVEIYAIKKLWVDKRKVSLRETELCFGYLFNHLYWKIYRPERAKGDHKWFTSTPYRLMYGLCNIPPEKGSKIIVTKSVKDYMVLKKVSSYICGVQGESIEAINEENLALLRGTDNQVYINFDGDKPGKDNSMKFTKAYGFKHINVPDFYVEQGIKDFADLAKERGIQTVIDYFRMKGL